MSIESVIVHSPREASLTLTSVNELAQKIQFLRAELETTQLKLASTSSSIQTAQFNIEMEKLSVVILQARDSKDESQAKLNLIQENLR